MRVFVTVGSTQFDDLVHAILSESVLRAFRAKGYTNVVVQCGKYSRDLGEPAEDKTWKLVRDGVDVEVWRYKPTLEQDYAAADLVISHAGSGTILDVLRLGKPLIVVPNPSLLDNHQVDLAVELDKLGYLRASTAPGLSDCITSFSPTSLQPFPPMVASRFRDLMDEEMGFQ